VSVDVPEGFWPELSYFRFSKPKLNWVVNPEGPTFMHSLRPMLYTREEIFLEQKEADFLTQIKPNVGLYCMPIQHNSVLKSKCQSASSRMQWNPVSLQKLSLKLLFYGRCYIFLESVDSLFSKG
jgi:hypothetical protein